MFVRAAISGVLHEGVIAASLTALMVLLFLGAWRGTLIIATSIPLSVLASIAVLTRLGETLNLMTLGGLALAVGILVDDATVEIENVHRHLAMGKPTVQAILDGAQEIALPAFVSTLCICIVFVPMFFLTGTALSVRAVGQSCGVRRAGQLHLVAPWCPPWSCGSIVTLSITWSFCRRSQNYVVAAAVRGDPKPI